MKTIYFRSKETGHTYSAHMDDVPNGYIEVNSDGLTEAEVAEAAAPAKPSKKTASE